MLQQWNTQINISSILETNQKLAYVSWKNIGFYKEQSPTIQVVQEQDPTTADIPKTTTVLHFKWLIAKPVWFTQRSL